MNAKSSLKSKYFEFTIFNVSFDPGYNLLKLNLIQVQHAPAMTIYKCGGLVDPGKYRNILLNAQSPLKSKTFELTIFNVSFDPGYNLIKVDLD